MRQVDTQDIGPSLGKPIREEKTVTPKPPKEVSPGIWEVDGKLQTNNPAPVYDFRAIQEALERMHQDVDIYYQGTW